MKAKYEAQEITVVNNFQPPCFLPWVQAFCAASDASITVFDNRKRLIHYNNLFGTLDDADPDDLLDLYTVFGYYSRFYENWRECMEIVKRVFTVTYPAHFKMRGKYGWDCDCVAYPVNDSGKLGGVILLAHKVLVYGSAVPGGGGQRE